MPQQLLEHLEKLISCDTQNPPRDISSKHPIFQTIQNSLGDEFSYELNDLGEGSVTLFAKRGAPKLLFNVHVDTVPCGENWKTDPLVMTVKGERAYGRGVCDIKGAAAALLTAAQNTDVDFAILFSSDEEAGDSRCVKSFCESTASNDFEGVIVAEPTECSAVIEHRGFLSATGVFQGLAGHSSKSDLLPQSANHRAIQWAQQALENISLMERNQLKGGSVCFNLGTIQGGTKDNVIADRCEINWSMRLPPLVDDTAIRNQLMPTDRLFVNWDITCMGPACPASHEHLQHATQFCRFMNIEIGSPVDFWTEAALFSQAGLPAIVMGPGHINQAHTIDEWVEISQLEQAAQRYQQLAEGSQSETGFPQSPEQSKASQE